MKRPFYLIIFFSLSLYTLQAQVQPKTSGILLSPAISHGSVQFEDEMFDDKDRSSGIDLRIGYGFNQRLTMFLEMSGGGLEGNASQLNGDGSPQPYFTDDYCIGMVSLGGRWHFGKQTKTTIFYGELALQSVGFMPEGAQKGNWEIKGGGLSLGGGLLVYLKEKFALDLGLRISGGKMKELFIDGEQVLEQNLDPAYGTVRMSVGALWYL